jgi:N-acetylglucosamine kinase-like BadF-type ATPase
VLAVDGGGFKTDVALLDSSGGLLSLVRGEASSPQYLGIEGSIHVLERLLEQAVARARLKSLDRPLTAIAHVLLAGADLPEERATLQSRFERLRWSERLVLDNDTLALLRAGTNRGWGIAVVCGTGMNCYGLAPDGREVRFPALGEITGDWGGGSDVGLAALAAASRSADGRGPSTALESAVPAHFGFAEPLDVSSAIHVRQLSTARLSELAPVVLYLSGEDAVAAGIVRRLADEVIALASATLRRLELADADPDVVLGGSLLRSLSREVIDRVEREIHELTPNARVVVSASEPIVGAALLGLDALAAGESALARARAELDAAAPGLNKPLPVTSQ